MSENRPVQTPVADLDEDAGAEDSDPIWQVYLSEVTPIPGAGPSGPAGRPVDASRAPEVPRTRRTRQNASTARGRAASGDWQAPLPDNPLDNI
jgi:hypothetical protein